MKFKEKLLQGTLIKRYKRFFVDIEIGSYPFFKQGKVGVSIVIRSTEENLISSCYKDIEDFIKKKKLKFWELNN